MGGAFARSPLPHHPTCGEQFAHLCIFARRLFPLGLQVLLNLIDQDQERVGLAALCALSQTTHPGVRKRRGKRNRIGYRFYSRRQGNILRLVDCNI